MSFVIMFFGFSNEAKGQTVVWEEVFPESNNTTTDPEGRWTLNPSNNNSFSIRNNELRARGDINGLWSSESIDISGYAYISVSVDIRAEGSMENADYIELEYNVDGAGWNTFGTNGYIQNNFGSAVATQNNFSGNSLLLRIRMVNNANNEYYYADNIVVTGSSNEIITYCSPAAGGNTGITSVTFNGVTQNSPSDGSYTEYTGTFTSVLKGSSYNISVGVNVFVDTYVRAWIDWNIDGDFSDSGEAFDIGIITSTGTIGPYSVVIPSGATTGTPRMRIGVSTNNYPDPCDAAVQYGEFEDYTINVSPALPTVSFTTASQSSSDESGTMIIVAELSDTYPSDVTVPFTVNASSTANGGGTDYSIPASPITITAGNTTADIAITITSDNDSEDDETVIVDMGTPTNAVQGAITSHVATITDDDPGFTLAESGGFTQTSETGATDAFSVVLKTQPASDVVLDIVSGDASEGTVSPSTLTFTSGNWNSPQSVTVTGIDDAVADGDIIYNVSVSVNVGSSDASYSSVPDQTLSVTNTDDDGCTATGTILMERWDGINGTVVTDLTGNANYPENPTSSNQLTSFEITTDVADNYGVRIRGYICAPASGDYVFWIASDDNSQLWLSTDDTPGNRGIIAYVDNWTDSREWNPVKYASQQSSPITLIAGQQYYIEALMKEGWGGDNLAVGWAKPGESTAVPSEVIPGTVLSPYVISIITETISGITFCAGNAIDIPFTITGTFNASNVFTAQLSDENGSFASPVDIGSVTSDLLIWRRS